LVLGFPTSRIALVGVVTTGAHSNANDCDMQCTYVCTSLTFIGERAKRARHYQV